MEGLRADDLLPLHTELPIFPSSFGVWAMNPGSPLLRAAACSTGTSAMAHLAVCSEPGRTPCPHSGQERGKREAFSQSLCQVWVASLLLRGLGSELGVPGEGAGNGGAGEVPCTVSWIRPRSSPYELMAWQLKNTESPRSAGLSWRWPAGADGGERGKNSF